MKLRKEIDDVFEEPDFDENHLWEYFKQDKFPYLKGNKQQANTKPNQNQTKINQNQNQNQNQNR